MAGFDNNVPSEAEAFEDAVVYAAEERARALRLEAAPEVEATHLGGVAACLAISIAEQKGYQHLLPLEWGGPLH